MVEGRKFVCSPRPGSVASWPVLYERMSIWLEILPPARMEGQHGEKQFREKFENATHNSSVILFAVDRKEKPIRLGSGEYPLPSQCGNIDTHTHTHAGSFSRATPSVTHKHTQIRLFTGSNTTEGCTITSKLFTAVLY